MELEITNGQCPHCEGQGSALSQSKTRREMARVRKSAGLSQTELAQKMRVHRSTVCRLESGAQEWHRGWVHRWLKAVRVEAQAA